MNLLDLIYIPVAIATVPAWAGKKRAGWRERFGHTPALAAVGEGRRGRLLLHAVSVGEVNALRTLVPLLIEGGAEVVVSTTTDTGMKRARDLFAGTCRVVRYPLDFSWSVRRFLDSVRPDAVALVELEVWPNFVKECERRGVPVCVINGRLSERSFRGYRKIRALLRRTFGRLVFVAAQEAAYAERFAHLGVASERVSVTGSVKWDNARIEDEVAGAAELAREMGIDRSRPLIVAGSTGPTRDGGEEAMLHRACPPGVQLLCAPRKPERFDEAASAMPGCVRRSAKAAGGGRADRFLLDSIGELRQAYSLADVVVMGRSFGDLYGSDPLEPLGLGKATVIGPAVQDFASIVETLDKGGGIVRTTGDGLQVVLSQLLGDADRRMALAGRGRECIRANQGSSVRHAEMLLRLVGPKAGLTPSGRK